MLYEIDEDNYSLERNLNDLKENIQDVQKLGELTLDNIYIYMNKK